MLLGKTSVIGTFNFPGNAVNLYADGVFDATGGTFVAGSAVYFSDSLVTLGTGNSTLSPATRVAFMHNRVLIPAQVAWLNAEPFAMM